MFAARGQRGAAELALPPFSVIPAQAGIPLFGRPKKGSWVPAFAGMTRRKESERK
jgi:hypothetical protein